MEAKADKTEPKAPATDAAPRPKIQYMAPNAPAAASWSSARQATMLTLALLFAAVAVYRALLMFTGGAGPHDGEVQRTFAMIKPDCVRAGHKDEILQKIQDAGYHITRQREMTMSTEMAKEFYREHENTLFYDDLVAFMTSGPVTAMVLEKQNAIKDWRAWIGPTNAQRAKEVCPTCLRALYGTDQQENCLHGSDTRRGAKREINQFFLSEDGEPVEEETSSAQPPKKADAESAEGAQHSEL